MTEFPSMNSTFKRSGGALAARALALSVALSALPAMAQKSAAAKSAAATQAEMARKLEQLATELAEVKTQLSQLQNQQAQQVQQAQQSPQNAQAVQQAGASGSGWYGGAAGGTAAGASPAPVMAAAAPVDQGPATVISGYGELNYNRPTRQSDKAQLDLRRFVIGLQHRINDRTKLVTELEVEHAVTSASDPGEVAVEQAYVEHQLTPT